MSALFSPAADPVNSPPSAMQPTLASFFAKKPNPATETDREEQSTTTKRKEGEVLPEEKPKKRRAVLESDSDEEQEAPDPFSSLRDDSESDVELDA